jgi:hypothetical protein
MKRFNDAIVRSLLLTASSNGKSVKCKHKKKEWHKIFEIVSSFVATQVFLREEIVDK